MRKKQDVDFDFLLRRDNESQNDFNRRCKESSASLLVMFDLSAAKENTSNGTDKTESVDSVASESAENARDGKIQAAVDEIRSFINDGHSIESIEKGPTET